MIRTLQQTPFAQTALSLTLLFIARQMNALNLLGLLCIPRAFASFNTNEVSSSRVCLLPITGKINPIGVRLMSFPAINYKGDVRHGKNGTQI